MYSLEDLLHLMNRLRDPQYGCPWDIKQTYASIVPHTLEEAYEVADAIERGDFDHLQGELGDLLFQVVYYSQLAREEGRFEFAGVVDSITRKLIRRHPQFVRLPGLERFSFAVGLHSGAAVRLACYRPFKMLSVQYGIQDGIQKN